MKIKFEAPKGRRMKKQFLDIHLDTDNWFEFAYFPESKEWREMGNYRGETYSCNYCRCRSLKAAIRKIKKWNFPKGTKFRLYSYWRGKDVYITK